MKTVSSIGEFGLIDQVTKSLQRNNNVLIGPGDDCAVIKIGSKKTLLTTDLLIEGVHFKREWMTPEEIGFKAMRVNLSDIAAMGGRPLYALVSLALPKSCAVSYAEKIFSGLRAAAKEAGCVIVGGDTSAGDRIILNVAVIGEASGARILTRSGARVGDHLYVTGELGGSALGLKALRRGKRKGMAGAIRRHVRPPLRIAVGQALARMSGVHAAIDLSDGLAGDLRHILDQSGVGADIDVSSLPRPKALPTILALGGGEDYELLFAAAPRVKMPRKIHGIPVTKIGRITPKKQGLRFLENGRVVRGARGYAHF